MDYFKIAIGLLLLFIGGEALVRGSVVLSKRLGISAILIGVVVVGFGTSAPEMIVSIQASLKGQPDIALGNVVGSNIANVLLILGLAGVLTPVYCHHKAIHRDALVGVIASVALLVLSYVGIISRLSGAVMLLALIVYLVYSYRLERREKWASSQKATPTLHEQEVDELSSKMSLRTSIVLAIVGIIMLVFGADSLVEGASNVARQFGISEAVIGLSLVALGTSLPELATAISAAIKKHSDVIIGNVLGSNLFNILSILGVTSMIKPIPVTGQIATFDIPLALAIAFILLVIILVLKKIGRITAVLFIVSYFSYIAWLYFSGNIEHRA